MLLRRVAYVESKDGTESFTYRSGYDGGIWQIDQTAFLAREARTRDAVFVLDQSGSIGNTNFQLVREFCINLTKSFDIERSKTQIGVLGSVTVLASSFRWVSILYNFGSRQAIGSIPYPGGSTNTASALTLLPTAFTSARTSSQGIPKVAFVITDGRSDDSVATANAANILHSSHSSITVYGVAWSW
ncbi:hypothetical protein EMCRGX_G010194 [Ephydatia muelleri]